MPLSSRPGAISGPIRILTFCSDSLISADLFLSSLISLSPDLILFPISLAILFESDNSGKSKMVDSIVPEYNSLIMFEVSDHSWHQVREILTDIQRLTVTGWFHG